MPHLWFDTEAEKPFTTNDVKVLFKKIGLLLSQPLLSFTLYFFDKQVPKAPDSNVLLSINFKSTCSCIF